MKPFQAVDAGYQAVLDPVERAAVAMAVRRARAALESGTAATHTAAADAGASSSADEQAAEYLRQLPDAGGSATSVRAELHWLSPVASRDDPELAREFARLTSDDLYRARTARLAQLAAALDGSAGRKFRPCKLTVATQEVHSTVAALNDTRLVMAGILGIRTAQDAEAAGRLEPAPGQAQPRMETLMYVMVSVLADTLAEAALSGLDTGDTGGEAK